MGYNLNQSDTTSNSHYNTHKLFLITNHILFASSCSCIFLTLSLRLIPSLPGFFLILLHIFTILTAVTATLSTSSNKWYAAHLIATVLTAIFQGSVSVLIFTETSTFLNGLKSYVREEDGAVILKLAGGLCILIFCLEWVVLVLAFVLKFHGYVERENCVTLGGKSSGKVGSDQDLKDWPWPFQV